MRIWSFIMFSYEYLTGISPSAVDAQAREILENGWARRNYPAIRLDEEIPWELKDASKRSWNFYMHCWDMLDVLLAAHSTTKRAEWLNVSLKIAIEWSARYGLHSGQVKDTPFAWYDMAVGLRAYRLAYLIDAARAHQALTSQEDEVLWSCLLAHHAYLADDSNIAFHNNHGYYQVAGQLAMGRRFGERFGYMAAAYAQGKKRLRDMLTQQFAADGVHREHSPDYHRMVYDTLSGLIESGLVDSPELIELSERVERALAWFVLPNQRLANFGDSDYRSIARGVKQAERKWRTAEMRWQASAGLIGRSPGGGLKRFESGGYFVYRHPANEFSEQNTYLAQIAAFHSRTHKHADDLSFIWYDRGSEILVDAGRYGYLGKTVQGSDLWLDGHWYSDPRRIYCESTRAHNCLEFDRLNYPRRGVSPYGVALGRSIELPNGLVAMETDCRHFKGNRHVRVLVLMPGKWLIVFDWFHDNYRKKHNVRQWFHLSETWSLGNIGEGYQARSEDKVEQLGIISLLSGATASRVYRGESEPELQGWWSPAEREMNANAAFFYERRAEITGSFATLFTFADKPKADIQRSVVNVSGRRLCVHWEDSQASHCLELSRPADGDMAVNYSKT